jgi:hypothetical protein
MKLNPLINIFAMLDLHCRDAVRKAKATRPINIIRDKLWIHELIDTLEIAISHKIKWN